MTITPKTQPGLAIAAWRAANPPSVLVPWGIDPHTAPGEDRRLQVWPQDSKEAAR